MMSQPQENKVDLFKWNIEKWSKAKAGTRIVWKMRAQKIYQEMTHFENLLLADMAKIYTVEEARLALCVGLRAPCQEAFTVRIAELRLPEA